MPKNNQLTKTQSVNAGQIIKMIFEPIKYPYQQQMIQILLYMIEIGDLDLIFQSLRLLYRSASMSKKYDQAKYWIAQAHIVASKSKPSSKIISVWIWASEVEIEKGTYILCLRYLENALSFSYELNNRDYEMQIYSKISKCYYYLGNIQLAKQFNENSIKIDNSARQDLKASITKISRQNKFYRYTHTKFNADILNSMWLPTNSLYIGYFMKKDQKSSLHQRIAHLKFNIKRFYQIPEAFNNIKALNIDEQITNQFLQQLNQQYQINDKVIISHRTQNKNIDMFATSQTNLPVIVKMIKNFEIQVKKLLQLKF